MASHPFKRLIQGMAVICCIIGLGACTTGQVKTEPTKLASRPDHVQIQTSKRVAEEITSLTQLGAIAIRSYFIDPVIRPVSHHKAMFAVALKSGSGAIRRTYLNNYQFPKLDKQPIPSVIEREGMDLERWEQRLDEITHQPASSGQIEFLIDGEAYFNRLTQEIRRAHQSVDVRTYIFDNDDYALEIADLIKSRSNDIEVRVLADELGQLAAHRVNANSQPEAHRPPLSLSMYLETNSNVRYRTQSNHWLSGDHVKTTIIDESMAFVGGMNIGREYRYDWHDLMMQVQGPIVAHIQHDFDIAWAKAGYLGDLGALWATLTQNTSSNEAHGYPIRLLQTFNHDSEIYRAQLEAIRRAQAYIYIENAYISDDEILFELAKARKRGVDVRVIFGSDGDEPVMHLSNTVSANTLLEHGVRVYLYPGMSHVKAAIIDGWACVGSANFDKLSLQINREINLATSDSKTVESLKQQLFERDFEKSYELQKPLPSGWKHTLAEIVSDEFL